MASKATVNFSGILDLDAEDWKDLKTVLNEAMRSKTMGTYTNERAKKLYDLMEEAEEETE